VHYTIAFPSAQFDASVRSAASHAYAWSAERKLVRAQIASSADRKAVVIRLRQRSLASRCVHRCASPHGLLLCTLPDYCRWLRHAKVVRALIAIMCGTPAEGIARAGAVPPATTSVPWQPLLINHCARLLATNAAAASSRSTTVASAFQSLHSVLVPLRCRLSTPDVPVHQNASPFGLCTPGMPPAITAAAGPDGPTHLPKSYPLALDRAAAARSSASATVREQGSQVRWNLFASRWSQAGLQRCGEEPCLSSPGTGTAFPSIQERGAARNTNSDVDEQRRRCAKLLANGMTAASAASLTHRDLAPDT
jgi:hypothetical protein